MATVINMTSYAGITQILTVRRLLLAAAVFLAAVVAFGFLAPRPSYSGGTLTVAEAHQQAESGAVTLVDIRRPDEWKRTGIGAGAVTIDMRREDFLVALAEAAGPDRSAPIALICARGVRSARLSQALTNAGYTNIIDVPEGMLGSSAGPGWLKSNLPTRPFEEAQS